MNFLKWSEIRYQRKIIPIQSISIAGKLCNFSCDNELVETSWISELVSIKPPQINPIDKKVTLQPRELKNLFPDFIWTEVRTKVEIESKSLL